MVDPRSPSRTGSVLALVVAAIVGGAVAATGAAAFIWSFETLIELVWTDLPDALGVDPYGSWFLFAVPVLGGVLVGFGQRFLGDHPRAIDENIELWRRGGHIEPKTLPATATNSLAALVAGGPIGFEAALIGLIGGIATWVGGRIGRARSLVMQAWGVERDENHAIHTLPYWLAAVSGLFVYRWLPFGQLDLGFRLDDFDGRIGVADGLVVVAFGLVVAVPVTFAFVVVGRAEVASFHRRSPVLVGIAGGLVFATMALGSQYVLFSGQNGFRALPELGMGELFYLAVAKWLALVIALCAGWRGGPIFPMFFAAAALGLAVNSVLDVGSDLIMAAAVAAVSAVVCKGRIPVAFVLALYAVPVSYAGVLLLAALGAAIGLAIIRTLGPAPSPEPLAADHPAQHLSE